MNITEMTKKDFESLRHRNRDENVICDSIIILPSRRLHDSGYRCMDFVAVKDIEPICLLSGCSDVIHIEGVGGYGDNWLNKYNNVPSLVPPSSWSIDCLPKSGLLRIWPSSRKIRCGSALSSFEIFSINEEK